MSDGIRELIQNRIDEITAEVDRLRVALAALGSKSAAAPEGAQERHRGRAGAGAPDESPGQGGRPRRAARHADGASGRTSPGATRDAVLAALAGGEPMTAGQVAERSGLARGTVSTTLSRLARSGAVEKADRGYRLTS